MINVEMIIEQAQKVRPLILAKVPSSDIADVLQDIRFSLMTALPRFDGKSKIETYVYAIAKRRIADYYRERQRQKKSVEAMMRKIQDDIRNTDRIEAKTLGYINMTKKERTVLFCLAQGLNNKEMARILYLSPNTIRSHLKSIYKKFGCRDRTKIALLSARLFKEEGK
jgi:RNA polymerase sigma factor (sigma-70 family)